MFKAFWEDFKSINVWQKSLFILIVAGLAYYGLLHAGLIKLPPAKAYDCSSINESKNIEIKITKAGFDPKNVQSKVCDTLVFKNLDTEVHWPAVGPHPTHTSYPGFDAGRALQQNDSFEFQVNRPGSYSFHDHLNEQLTGSITISK